MTHTRIIELENITKENRQGPSHCALFLMQDETTKPIFLECDYAQSIWDDTTNKVGKIKTLSYAW